MGFKLPTVNKFLFCLSLETGGTVLGWCTAILSAILLVTIAALYIVIIVAFSTSKTQEDENLVALLIGTSIWKTYIISLFVKMIL